MERERAPEEYDKEAEEIIERVFREEPENEPENPVEAASGLAREPEEGSANLSGLAKYLAGEPQPRPERLRETAAGTPQMLYALLRQRVERDFAFPEVGAFQPPRMHSPEEEGAAYYVYCYPESDAVKLEMKSPGRGSDKSVIFRPHETVISEKRRMGRGTREVERFATDEERRALERIIRTLKIAERQRF